MIFLVNMYMQSSIFIKTYIKIEMIKTLLAYISQCLY